MIRVHTDGGSRGNPGPHGIGVIIENDSGKEYLKLGLTLNDTGTNNDAEYMALITAVRFLSHLTDKTEEITIYTDSNLAYSQISGKWKIKDPKIEEYVNRFKDIAKDLNYTIQHIPREENMTADKYVNKALDMSGIVVDIKGQYSQLFIAEKEFLQEICEKFNTEFCKSRIMDDYLSFFLML